MGPQGFADAAGVEFPLGDKTPSFVMSEKGTGMNIWYWRVNAGLPAIADPFIKSYPNLTIEQYSLESHPVHRSRRITICALSTNC